MIGYAEFSELRLIDLFPGDPHVAKYCSADLDDRSFDWEWLGGGWDSDQIPGVELLYPSEDGSKTGAVRVSLPIPGIDVRFREAAGVGDPSRQVENAVRVLPALGLPFRFHDGLATVEAAIKGLSHRKVTRHRDKALRLTWLEFRCGEPTSYQFELIVQDEEGLLQVEMLRVDLAEKNNMRL